MPHDRGCSCGNERWDYGACIAEKGKRCAKYYIVTELWNKANERKAAPKLTRRTLNKPRIRVAAGRAPWPVS